MSRLAQSTAVTPASPPSSPSWAVDVTEEALADVAAFLGAPSLVAFAAPLSLALADLRDRVERHPGSAASVHLPWLVHLGMGGTLEGARAVTRVTALLELGIDLCDHIADRELGPAWRAVPPPAIALTSSLALAALPQLAIEESGFTPALRCALQRAVASAGPEMAAGQLADFLAAPDAAAEPSRALAACDGKSGARRALFARLAALSAGASDERSALAARFAHELGVARQLSSDAGDLRGPDSRDLAAGVLTYPIAWARARLSPVERERFDALRGAARTDREAAREVAALVDQHGGIARTMAEVGLRQWRSREALSAALQASTERARLESIVDACRAAHAGNTAAPSTTPSMVAA